MLLLSIINQYINIKGTPSSTIDQPDNCIVYGGQPSSKDSDEPVATITGAAPEVSKREVFWGLLEDARQQDKSTDDGAVIRRLYDSVTL